MRTKVFTFILLALTMIGYTSCSSDEPIFDEEEKIDDNSGNSNNNTNNNNGNNGSGSSGNSNNNNNNNGSGSNNSGNNDVEKKTSLTFTVKVQNKTGLTPVSNIGVYISGVGVSQRKQTNSSGICVFDDLSVSYNTTLSYKVTGQVTKNGVSNLREITGSIKVNPKQSYNVVATF